jgi:hypothetical protein
MELDFTQEDQARIIDSTHQIQSASNNLAQIDSRKVPNMASIRRCLQDADMTLRGALRSLRGRKR